MVDEWGIRRKMIVFPTERLSKNIIVARMLDLLLVSITHRVRWPKPASALTEILQSSCGEIGPAKVQFDIDDSHRLDRYRLCADARHVALSIVERGSG